MVTTAPASSAAESRTVARFTIQVERSSGYQFTVRFDKEHHPPLHLDEPPPLGEDHGPNAARILAAAIGNCLSASLAFCLEKTGVELEHLKTEVDVELVRNAERRLRIGRVDVTLHPRVAVDDAALAGCVDRFQDFCVVTESVRHGIDVHVHVDAADGSGEDG